MPTTTNSAASARLRPLSLRASWVPGRVVLFFPDFFFLFRSDIFRPYTLHRGAGQHGTGVSGETGVSALHDMHGKIGKLFGTCYLVFWYFGHYFACPTTAAMGNGWVVY